MQVPKYAESEQSNQVADYLRALERDDQDVLGAVVVSGHIKLRGMTLVNQFFATGICPLGPDQLPARSIPPLLPILTGRNAIGRVDLGVGLNQQEQVALTLDLNQALETLGPIARSSQILGGLSQVTYPVSEETMPFSNSATISPLRRESIQSARFQMAWAHLSEHVERDTHLWSMREEAARKLGFSEIEYTVGELYSTARAFGVKEITPRIEQLIPELLSHWSGSQGNDQRTKLSSLIVKLKRKGLISR